MVLTRPPQLVISDLDGTLIAGEDGLSARTVAAVQRTIGAGTAFVVASGRPWRWVRPVLGQLDAPVLSICTNGSLVCDASLRRVVWSRLLKVPVLHQLAARATAVLPACGLAVERMPRLVAERGRHMYAEQHYRHTWHDESLTVVSSRDDLLSCDALKLLISHPSLSSEHMLRQLRPNLGDLGHVTYSSPAGLLEVSAVGVTKAAAAVLARRLGVPTRQALVFGDMPNDIELMQWAGHSVAMADAHRSVLEVAKERTTANTSDGVAAVLERWF